MTRRMAIDPMFRDWLPYKDMNPIRNLEPNQICGTGCVGRDLGCWTRPTVPRFGKFGTLQRQYYGLELRLAVFLDLDHEGRLLGIGHGVYLSRGPCVARGHADHIRLGHEVSAEAAQGPRSQVG